MKKKGFTTTEIFLMIVTFSVLLVVAIPFVWDSIEDAKKGALRDYAYGLESAAELLYAKNLVTMKHWDEVVFTIKNGVILSSNPDMKLEFKGRFLSVGQILIEENGNIWMRLYDGKYCISKTLLNEIFMEEMEKKDCNLPDLMTKH